MKKWHPGCRSFCTTPRHSILWPIHLGQPFTTTSRHEKPSTASHFDPLGERLTLSPTPQVPTLHRISEFKDQQRPFQMAWSDGNWEICKAVHSREG
ncbi:hypothetical protein AVEN_229941-1 [Araneus ventricosus]|uniref:Uncharacterized protein n=1 Tax=Araneus ventricosus TaxID=182803 RepID=A0A4Y2BY60_ARAVE|nr:hypothetical protein AVEN_229941-1 [Araneus ventricosus]